MKVAGQAAPAGSKTADPVMRKNPTGGLPIPVLDPKTGRPIVRQRHANEHTRPWMDIVAQQARYMWGAKPLLEGAVWCELRCYQPRPKTHFRTGRFSHLLRPDAPAYPHKTKTGDSDKLRRAVQDALTGVVYLDDKLVVDGDDRKFYSDRAYAVIRVGLMAAQTTLDAGLVESPDPVGQPSLLAAA